MELYEIVNLVKTEQYDFLRTNPHLKNHIILLTLGGSHAYGTNVEGSDVDLRGCAVNSTEDLLGLSSFETFENKETDTVIYSLNKLIDLLINCNPNVIEMLGSKPVWVHPDGQKLIDNRKLFLSKKAIHSFGGYANAQLRRLQNAVARDRVTQPEQEKHIMNALKQSIYAFNGKYNMDNAQIKLFLKKSSEPDKDVEVCGDINLTDFPIRQFSSLMNDLSNVIRTYNTLNNRNKKKDFAHLNKHAMHLIRLYLMAIDIFEKEEIITYRENDRDFLLSIRNGKYQNEDGTYKPEFFEFVTELENKMKYAMENTNLPDKPNIKKIEELVIEINKKHIITK